jgi:hypothetical protein
MLQAVATRGRTGLRNSSSRATVIGLLRIVATIYLSRPGACTAHRREQIEALQPFPLLTIRAGPMVIRPESLMSHPYLGWIAVPILN